MSSTRRPNHYEPLGAVPKVPLTLENLGRDRINPVDNERLVQGVWLRTHLMKRGMELLVRGRLSDVDSQKLLRIISIWDGLWRNPMHLPLTPAYEVPGGAEAYVKATSAPAYFFPDAQRRIFHRAEGRELLSTKDVHYTDYGCGDGETLIQLFDACGWPRTVGLIDRSEDFLCIAEARLRARGFYNIFKFHEDFFSPQLYLGDGLRAGRDDGAEHVFGIFTNTIGNFEPLDVWKFLLPHIRSQLKPKERFIVFACNTFDPDELERMYNTDAFADWLINSGQYNLPDAGFVVPNSHEIHYDAEVERVSASILKLNMNLILPPQAGLMRYHPGSDILKMVDDGSESVILQGEHTVCKGVSHISDEILNSGCSIRVHEDSFPVPYIGRGFVPNPPLRDPDRLPWQNYNGWVFNAA